MEITIASPDWRSPLSLRSKKSTSSNNGLQWSSLRDKQDNVSCVAFHNESNYLVCADTSSDGDTGSVISLPSKVADLEFSVASSFTQPSSFTDLSWFGNHLMCASNDGRVYRYNLRPFVDRPSVSADRYDLYVHSRLKGVVPSAPPPGKMAYSTKIRRVAICPDESKSGRSGSFAAIENQNLHLWDMERNQQPFVTRKVSDWPIYAIDWSPFDTNIVMLGGMSKALKAVDRRMLSTDSDGGSGSDSGQGKSEVWKIPNSHMDSILDIKFHPFVRHIVASCGDDGVIKVWDLRFANSTTPMLVFQGHFAGVRSIGWSPTHCEFLVSGGYDRQVKLWSMALPPSHEVFSKQMESPVVGVSFTRGDGSRVFAVDQSGAIDCAHLTSEFIAPLHSRFKEPEDSEEREVEALIYSREFSSAFKKAIALADKHSKQNRPEKALPLLELCFPTRSASLDASSSSGMFGRSAITPSDARKTFMNEVQQLHYYIPPGYHERFGTKIEGPVMQRIQQLRLNLELQSFVKDDDATEIWSRKKDIGDLLQKDANAIPLTILVGIVRSLMQFDYSKALEYGEMLADIFGMFGNFHDFGPIARMLLYPTVFEPEKVDDAEEDEDDDSSSDEEPAPPPKSVPSTPTSKTSSLAKSENQPKSAPLDHAVVLKLLQDRDSVCEQLSFMKRFYRILWSSSRKKSVAAGKPTSNNFGVGDDEDDEIADKKEKEAEGPTLVEFAMTNSPTPLIWSATVNRIYIAALLGQQQFDRLFIVAMSLHSQLQPGLPFREHLEDSMTYAAPRFVKLVKESQVRDRSSPWDPARYWRGMSMVINVLSNCNPSPEEFLDLDAIAASIKPLSQEIESALTQLLNHPDPALGTSGKIQAGQKAKSMLATAKEMTGNIKPSSDPTPSAIIWEKEIKKFITVLNGFA